MWFRTLKLPSIKPLFSIFYYHYYVSHLWGGVILFLVQIPFASALALAWHFFGVGVTLSCLHNILCISCWILTKFSRIYNWDITNNWLDFSDLDLIFKVTAVKTLKIRWGISVFSENAVSYHYYYQYFYNFRKNKAWRFHVNRLP